jgi:nicotinamidase-related amidase
MSQALLIIDVQNDYFSTGRMPLVGADLALAQINRLTKHCFAQQQMVVYIQHINPAPAAFFQAGSFGVALHPQLLISEQPCIICKQHPNSFDRTLLHAQLQQAQIQHLVITGMMTHMCVDSTTRAAYELGYHSTLISDATACKDLSYAQQHVSAAAVQTAYLAALGRFARLCSTDAWLAHEASQLG